MLCDAIADSPFTRKKMIRTYSELITLPTFEERFVYLKLNGSVGVSTFGHDRYLNQKFYWSREWRTFRDHIIVRDHGCDLAILDRPIFELITVHHINPIFPDDIINNVERVLDPENVISTTDLTHRALHYGDESLLPSRQLVDRFPNDMAPWRA